MRTERRFEVFPVREGGAAAASQRFQMQEVVDDDVGGRPDRNQLGARLYVGNDRFAPNWAAEGVLL